MFNIHLKIQVKNKADKKRDGGSIFNYVDKYNMSIYLGNEFHKQNKK